SANENTLAHVVGLSLVSSDTDADATLNDIHFGISLAQSGQFGIFESGTPVPGPDVGGTWGTYVAGDRFRVTLRDNGDGTAVVAYARLTGPCTPGRPCALTVFYTHVGAPASYPLRVDASFQDQGAKVTDVRIVRIK